MTTMKKVKEILYNIANIIITLLDLPFVIITVCSLSIATLISTSVSTICKIFGLTKYNKTWKITESIQNIYHHAINVFL